MDFLEMLKEWNGGILRGSQIKLSKILNVSSATIARWASGDLQPSEEKIRELAKVLKRKESELQKNFSFTKKYSSSIKGNHNNANVGDNLIDIRKDIDLIKKDIEILKLSINNLKK